MMTVECSQSRPDTLCYAAEEVAIGYNTTSMLELPLSMLVDSYNRFYVHILSHFVYLEVIITLVQLLSHLEEVDFV